MSGTRLPALTPNPIGTRPSGVMPCTRLVSIKSLVGRITRSTSPVFSLARMVARLAPPTVTGMFLLALYCAASTFRPGRAAGGARMERLALRAGMASSARIRKARLNRGRIHMQNIDQVFEITLDRLFHIAAFRDHGSVKVQHHPALVILLDQEGLDGGEIHAAGIGPVLVAAQITEPAMAAGFRPAFGHGNGLVAAQTRRRVLVMNLRHARPVILDDLQRVHAAKGEMGSVGSKPNVAGIGQFHQAASLMLVLDQRADMGMGRQPDAHLYGFHTDSIQGVGADLDLVVGDVIASRPWTIVHLEMVAIAEGLDEIAREL